MTVTAADPFGLNDTTTVTIAVNNVDEKGTVTLSTVQPIAGIPLTATLDDRDDVDVSGGSVTWSWAAFSEPVLLTGTTYQRGNRSHLHAGYRRCGPLRAAPLPPTPMEKGRARAH